MTGERLDTGWAFPVGISDGDVETVTGETDIREAIRMILGTAKGERVMRPAFGCGIHDHVFASVTPPTLRTIERDVREALQRWEPRIEVDSVAAERADDPGRVDVTITYRVPALDRDSSLVYPVDIGEGDA
jgi:phage baseplate assembly protein W